MKFSICRICVHCEINTPPPAISVILTPTHCQLTTTANENTHVNKKDKLRSRLIIALASPNEANCVLFTSFSSLFAIMTSGEAGSSGCKTRSRDKAFDADRDCVPFKDFQPSTKLPTIKSVIGMLRYHLERQGKGTVTNAMTVREVAKQVYAKY